MYKYFYVSGAATILGLGIACAYGGLAGGFITAILAILEVSLSFDNAIVNAVVLKNLDPIWQKRFLTWGILIAVFGMRLIFPLALVAFVTGLGAMEVFTLALKQPQVYADYLLRAHASIAAFGGMFLMMVFLEFVFNPQREVHWLGRFERKLAQIGNLSFISIILALLILLILQSFATPYSRPSIVNAGIAGIAIYSVIHILSQKMSMRSIKHGSIMSFIYLEVLDASFSFDGVIGAFAITQDIIIIMLGLGIGAFFVRSLTILLVHKRTLQKFIYLEHGAHYAIGALALLMLSGIYIDIPEVIIGCIGFVIILLSYISSRRSLNAA